MVTAAMFGYISASPFLLQDGFGLSAQWFSACFALNAIGIILATQIGRILLRRTSSFVLLTVGVYQALVGAIMLTVTLAGRLGAGDGAGLAVRHGVRSRVRAAARVGHRDGPASSESPARRPRCSGLTQFALGAITAPLVGIGDVMAGTAIGVTALGAR